MAEVKKTTKSAAKIVKKAAPKKEIAEATVAIKKPEGLKIDVLDVKGNVAETLTLPETVFAAKINPALVAQAVRVYLANQRLGTASSKTRGEVDGSTRKIYRQKGTGRARHGGIRAPIFVKGGVAHGPKPHDFSLSMPTKMKRAALFSALTAKLQSGNIVVVTGLEKVGNKTKTMAEAMSKVGGKKTLIVMPEVMEGVYKAARNIKGVSITPAAQLNTYAVLEAQTLVLMKESIASLEKTFLTRSVSSEQKEK